MYFPFEETDSSTVFDSSKAKRNASLVDIPNTDLSVSGKFGSGIKLGSGATSYIDMGANQVPLPADWMTAKLSGLADQIGEAAEATLDTADVSSQEVNKLIFVGGSSLMQVVEQALCSRFPNAQVHRGAALTAIVDGLALASAHAFDS